MGNSLNKANAFYLVASSLATLTLLASVTFAAFSNVPLPLAFTLAMLSVLVITLSRKIISSNRERKIERDEFTKREQELENKIILEKEAKKAAHTQMEGLKNLSNQKNRELVSVKQQLDNTVKELNDRNGKIKKLENKIVELNDKIAVIVDASNKNTEKLSGQLNLAQEKSDVEEEVKKLHERVIRLEAENAVLSEEKESLECKLESKTDHIAEILQCKDKLGKVIVNEINKNQERLRDIDKQMQEQISNLARTEKFAEELEKKYKSVKKNL